MDYKKEDGNINKNSKISTIVTCVLLAIAIFLFVLVIDDEIDSGEKGDSGNISKTNEVIIYTSSSPTQGSMPTNSVSSATMQTPVVTPSVEPTQRPEYTYGLPVYEKQPAVDMSYFNDAIFIGDSRMEDFGIFSGAARYSTFYAKLGLTLEKLINNDSSKNVKFKVNGEDMYLLDALRKNNDFKKVYVMMGYNELGWPGTASFKAYYERLLTSIREIKPDAIIYVYCVIPVGRSPRDADLSVENNTRIAEFNKVIQEICKEGKYHYLNVQEVMIDSEGYLPDYAATDGIHPTPEYYKIWLEYTKSHTI